MLGVSLSIPALALRARPAQSSAPSHLAPFHTINTDGWSVTASDPAAALGQSVLVSRQGYTGVVATMFSEALSCTAQVRLPFPDQETLSADRIALSDYIYATDSLAGVVNNSVETSPKPIANWALPDRKVIGDTLVAEVVAFHRNARDREQVAAVEFYATDGVNTVSEVITQSVISGQAGDQLPVIVYRCNLDVSGLYNPATITLNAKVYPHIGNSASILDSADQSEYREFSPRSYRRDTGLHTAPVLVYVSAGGDNATGAVSTDPAVAAAAPCATISGAINQLVAINGRIDGCEIRCAAGNHVLNSIGIVSTRPQDFAELTITRAPGLSLDDVTVSFGSAATRLRLGASGGWLRLFGVQVSRTGTTQINGEGTSTLHILTENCTFNNGSFASTIVNAAGNTRWLGVEITNATSQMMGGGGLGNLFVRGVLMPSPAVNFEGWLVLGCSHSGGFVHSPLRSQSGSIVAYNLCSMAQSLTNILTLASGADVVGVAFVQNIVEYTSALSGPALRISADGAQGNTDHIVLHHNTLAGHFASGRGNLLYCDTDSVLRFHKRMSFRGNIHVQINTKGDFFKLDGIRFGNWAYLYGVGCHGEFSQFVDSSGGGIGGNFAQAYPGLNANIGTSASIRNDPLFVDYQATTSDATAGAGGGDYQLQPNSTAKNTTQAILRFDAAGRMRSVVTSAGAYE